MVPAKYGFGRTELLPIRKTAEGVARYVGKYVTKHIGQRLPEDKGARLVRYSKEAGRAGTRFSWASPGAYLWRSKLGALCRMLHQKPDNYTEGLKESFGSNWVYVLGAVIQSIKLPEFHPEAEASASLRAAWVVAVNERERRQARKRIAAARVSKPFLPLEPETAKPARPWVSWLERTSKED